MIVTELKYSINLDSGVQMTPLKNSFLSGDQDAHRFAVSCFRSSSRQSVDLTGAGVIGYFIRADQSTVVIDGKVEDNCAVLTLPAACYAKQGRFSLVIKASLGDVIHTILWVEGAVSVSHTGAIIDPGEVVPTLDELLAQIAAMEIATDNANAAANNANQAATEAVNIATNKGNEAVTTAMNAAKTALDAALAAANAKADLDNKVQQAHDETFAAAVRTDTAQGLTEAQQAQARQNISAASVADLLTKAPAIKREASGPMVTVTDAAAQPAVQLVTHIEPVQEGEGDPGPNNVRPISGWDKVAINGAGQNLLKKVSINAGGLTFQSGPDGYIVNGTISGDKAVASLFDGQLPAGEYVVEGIAGASNATYQLVTYVGSKVYYATDTAITLKLTATAHVKVVLYCYAGFGTFADVIMPWCLRLQAQAQPYTMPEGQLLTAELPETVYGGTLQINQDGSARLEVTCGGDAVTAAMVGKWGEHAYTIKTSRKALFDYVTELSNIRSNILPNIKSLYVWEGTGYGVSQQNSGQVGIRVEGVQTLEDMQAWVEANGLFVWYRLEKPVTYDLTVGQFNMLKGTNNVWSDCGDTALVYVADTETFTRDTIKAEIQAAMAAESTE